MREQTTTKKLVCLIAGLSIVSAVLCGCNIVKGKSVSSNPKDLDTLTFTSDGWTYDEALGVYSHDFAYSPIDDKDIMKVSVPEGYLKAEEEEKEEKEESSDTSTLYSVSCAEEGRANVYKCSEAPVLIFIGEREIADYSKEGMVTVSLNEGCSAIEVEMAVRALKYNAKDNKKIFPASTKAYFLIGGSTMALAGVTADDESSLDILQQHGAIMKYEDGKEISDNVLGVIIDDSCTSAAIEESAEAWMYAYKNEDQNLSVLEAADTYGEYINKLELISNEDAVMKCEQDDNGHLIKGNYTDFVEYMFAQLPDSSEIVYEHEADYQPEKIDAESKLTDPTEAMYYLTVGNDESYTATVAPNWQIGICIDKPGEVLTAFNLYSALYGYEDSSVGIIPYRTDAPMETSMVCAWVRTATATEMEK